jgi:hypothetical protein
MGEWFPLSERPLAELAARPSKFQVVFRVAHVRQPTMLTPFRGLRVACANLPIQRAVGLLWTCYSPSGRLTFDR